MQSGIPAFSAHRESVGFAGIPGHSCLFRNCKHFFKWLSDHYHSWDKCKAEFLHFCTLGIAGKCRNSRSFGVSAAVFISGYTTYIHPVRDIESGN